MMVPTPCVTLRYRTRRRRAASSLSERLRLLGELAVGLLEAGLHEGGMGAEIRSERLRSLSRSFLEQSLDRVTDITNALVKAATSPEGAAMPFRALVQALELRRAAGAAGGKVPFEGWLRSGIEPDEHAVLKGRTLVPLAAGSDPELLVADSEDGRVYRVEGPTPSCVILASRLVITDDAPLPRGRVKHPTDGAPIGPGVDRKLLARASGSLREVAAEEWLERCLPFELGPRPRWIGPVTILHPIESEGDYRIEDARGAQAHLQLPGGMLGKLDVDEMQYILARAEARSGELVLVPHVIWSGRGPGAARRLACFVPPAPACRELEDPLLHEVSRNLSRIAATGLSRSGCLRSTLEPLAVHLASSGHRTLATLLRRVGGGGDGAPACLALAGHLAVCARRAVRWFEHEGIAKVTT